MVIYLDLIILINLYCNFMIIILTKRLARITIHPLRIVLGTIVATAIVPLTIYFPHSIITSAIGKFIYSFFIIFTIFGFRNIFTLIKYLLIFYFITFSLGGGLLAVHFIISDTSIAMKQKMMLYETEINALLVLIGFPVVWYFTKNRMDRHGLDKIKYDELYEVLIFYDGKSVSTIGYLDSGNSLVEALTNRPVVICEANVIKNFFTDKDWLAITKMVMTHEMTDMRQKVKKDIHIIPYRVVGDKSNLLYALKPDKIQINYCGTLIETKKVLIGLQLDELCTNRSYQCLLHPQLIYHSTMKMA